jgi:peroxiredoxin
MSRPSGSRVLNVGDPFPHVTLPSSKGGTVALRDVFLKGPAVVGVVPPEARNTWLAAAERMTYHWLMEKFVQVYLVVDQSPAEARAAADEHGILASLLCDREEVLIPRDVGFYLVRDGIVASVVLPEEGPAALGGLVL